MNTGISSIEMSKNATAEPPRPSEVQEQRVELEKTAEELFLICSALEQRLVSVLRVGQDNVKGGAIPEPMLVPLASELRSVNQRFTSSLIRLHEIHSRIELAE